ncbi:MAG: GNAT family N-acetyltransferase [Anaerolineaceae bacterium]|nr:GNAT family N-acetyltransferase [Anaerolineaceae bacterium]
MVTRTTDQSNFSLRALTPEDQPWVSDFMKEHWGEDRIIVHNQEYIPSRLAGFAAFRDDHLAGLATYTINNNECELTSLNSLIHGQGTGKALLDAVRKTAISSGCWRLWLVTTNDNLHALGFYQKCGLRICAIYPGAVDEARKQKPAIPTVAENGLPIRDEIELEEILQPFGIG